MKRGKKMELVEILSLLKEGKSPIKISKEYDIPKSTLSRQLRKLKELGCVVNPSYGTWEVIKEVPKRPKDTITGQSGTSKKQIRGHAYIWVIEFLENNIDWIQAVKNYKKRHKKPKLSFNFICNNKVPRTIFKNKKIWLTKKGLTIYEPLDFFGKSSFQVKGMAIFEMDRLINSLLKELGQRKQFYRFTCSREHYAHIKNQIARQFNDKKQKIHVKYKDKWFWIDHSEGEHEQESNNTNTSLQAQKYYEDAVKNEFSMTHSKIIEGFKETNEMIKANAKNMKYYGDNMVTHVGVMKKIEERLSKMDERDERLLRAIERLGK